jgi:hypothetical protein
MYLRAMNKERIILYFLLLLIYSCSYNNPNPPVARIGNTLIYQNEIDSFYQNEIVHFKRQVLDEFIKTKLSKLYNTEQNSVPSYLLDISNVLKDTSFNKKIKNYDIQVFKSITDKQFRLIKNLYHNEYKVARSSKEIVVLFDFCCAICTKNDSIIRFLAHKYSINLIYIYYSLNISVSALACDMAAKYGKYWNLFDEISPYYCDEVDTINNLAFKCGIDTVNFRFNLLDVNLIEQHLFNQKIIEELQIYSVPTYIYNNKIYKDLKSLELVLSNQN